MLTLLTTNNKSDGKQLILITKLTEASNLEKLDKEKKTVKSLKL